MMTQHYGYFVKVYEVRENKIDKHLGYLMFLNAESVDKFLTNKNESYQKLGYFTISEKEYSYLLDHSDGVWTYSIRGEKLYV